LAANEPIRKFGGRLFSPSQWQASTVHNLYSYADFGVGLLLFIYWLRYIWRHPYGYTAAYIAYGFFGWLLAHIIDNNLAGYRIRRALARAPNQEARDYLEEHSYLKTHFWLQVLIGIACGLWGNRMIATYNLDTALAWTLGPALLIALPLAFVIQSNAKAAPARNQAEFAKAMRRIRQAKSPLVNPPPAAPGSRPANPARGPNPKPSRKQGGFE
jgi:hypothetical protein